MKILIWMGSSKKDLSKLPEDIIYAFYVWSKSCSEGKKNERAKPLKGFGGGHIIELIESDAAGNI